MTTEPDTYGVAANFIEGDKYVRTGAKCYITWGNSGWGAKRVQVWVRSRGGRVITRIIATKRLTNFRACWVPEHVRVSWGLVGGAFFTERGKAQRFAEDLERVYGVHPTRIISSQG